MRTNLFDLRSALLGAGLVMTIGAAAAPFQGGLASTTDIRQYLRIVQVDDGTGTLVPTLRIEGANLQLVNGLGATNGYPADAGSVDPAVTRTNSTGNLIVGYTTPGVPLTGSHNVLVGRGLEATSFGGVAVGADHTLDGPYASVAGGQRNHASGSYAAILGGRLNDAFGDASTVGGGWNNRASGTMATISGGFRNGAPGLTAVVSGGARNGAVGEASVVSGGDGNQAFSLYTTIGGGFHRTADGFADWRAGDLFEDQ